MKNIDWKIVQILLVFLIILHRILEFHKDDFFHLLEKINDLDKLSAALRVIRQNYGKGCLRIFFYHYLQFLFFKIQKGIAALLLNWDSYGQSFPNLLDALFLTNIIKSAHDYLNILTITLYLQPRVVEYSRPRNAYLPMLLK